MKKETLTEAKWKYQNCYQRCNAKWVRVSYRTPSLFAPLHLSLHCSSQMPMRSNRNQVTEIKSK